LSGFVCPECGESAPSQGFCTRDGAALAHVGDDDLLGAMVGSFRVTRLLGAGGMGQVYRGVHPSIGSQVAIKLLSRSVAGSRAAVERFFAEAKAVNLIRHEHIVNVIDLATLPDGRPYIMMEYLEGRPLSAVLRAGRPPGLGWLARYFVEVLDALAVAHAHGIIHRDLKPDNLWVTPAGHAKVLDFGIAKLRPEADVGTPHTHTGALLGTPHYMSPEQAAGRTVDIRSDLYSLAVVLYECVTGRRPFDASSLFELLRQHIEHPPMPPSQLNSLLPPAYEQVVLRALQKAPELRFATATDMQAALDAASRGLAAELFQPPLVGAESSALPTPRPVTPPLAPTAPSLGAVAATLREAPRPSRATGSLLPWVLTGGFALITLLALGALGVVFARRTLARDRRADVVVVRPGPARPPGAAPAAAQGPEPMEFFDKALGRARILAADAELVRVEAWDIGLDGRLGFRGPGRPRAEYYFLSPKGKRLTENHEDPRCIIRVTLAKDDEVATFTTSDCDERTFPKPKCSFADVLKRARPGISESSAELVKFTERTEDDPPQWFVKAGRFEMWLPDDCK